MDGGAIRNKVLGFFRAPAFMIHSNAPNKLATLVSFLPIAKVLKLENFGKGLVGKNVLPLYSSRTCTTTFAHDVTLEKLRFGKKSRKKNGTWTCCPCPCLMNHPVARDDDDDDKQRQTFGA